MPRTPITPATEDPTREAGIRTRSRRRRDRGNALPLTLVVGSVLSLVVVATANYTVTTLRYGQVAESRANTLHAANAAMDDAIEQLRLKRSLCATAAGGAGVTTTFPETINDSVATVTCRMIGGSVPPADGWALVITGQGWTSGPSFQFTLGGRPNVGGPVYVHDISRTSFSQRTTIVEGDLWYPDSACAGSGPGVTFRRSSVSIPNLDFDPTTRGIYCTNASWSTLFNTTPPVADTSGLPTNPPSERINRCQVFEPGIYTSLPLASGGNYFRSGNYVFRNLGNFEVRHREVTMGHIVNFEGFPATDNPDCDAVRQNDDPSGATLYLEGTTSIEIGPQGSFEVSRRQQGQFWVGVHALNSNPAGGVLMSARHGAQKDLAIQGLTWAPSSRLVFETVPAQKAAVLRGGAVLGSFLGGVSAAAIGFVIEIPTEQASTTLMLESSATDGRTTTRIRVIAEYRPSNGETAVNSWRVVEGLPDPS